MAKATKLILKDEEREELEAILHQRTVGAAQMTRARIILLKFAGESVDSIAEKVGLHRNSVLLCLKKFKEGGVKAALHDAPGRGRPVEIFDAERAWITDIACMKPTAFGYAAELWTQAKLTEHINKTAEQEGFKRLATISETSVVKILKQSRLKPFKIKYYCEERDPEFAAKMHNILVVYKQLSFQFDENGELILNDDNAPKIHTISYDEKPGIQAIGTTSPDLLPTKTCGTFKRDYEYKRYGTLSLLAGIDLQTGEAFPLLSTTHKSADFIAFLKMINQKYPQGDKIRLILDNHTVHTSKETREFLSTISGRFEFVFTPKHGSWLNMIEGFFSKMTRQMLRGIRVNSKEELAERIYQYFDEVNSAPVVYRWKYKMDEIDPDEIVKISLAI